MKKLLIPSLNFDQAKDNIEKLSALLDTLPEHTIDNQPWPEFRNELKAGFTIAHTDDALLLKYKVSEQAVRVATFETNGPVHKDTCVEFFVSFGTDKSYYNIEMNCIGVCRLAYGSGRLYRTFIPKEFVEQISSYAKMKTLPGVQGLMYEWEITVIIPITVFTHSDLTTLKGETGSGNFFKCGDDLPEPHFYTWNRIEAERPDFHLPEFFGELRFE